LEKMEGQDALKDQLKRELMGLKQELDLQKDLYKYLKTQTDNFNGMDDAQLLKAAEVLDQVRDGFSDMQAKGLPPIERGLDEVERKMRQGLSRKKGDVRKQLMDSLKMNKVNLAELGNLIEKLRKEDEKLSKEEEAFRKIYKYDDKERAVDLVLMVVDPLASQLEELARLQRTKDQLKRQVDALEQDALTDQVV